MLKVKDAIEEVIEKSQFLQFGMRRRLLNLSQLATFLQPYITAKTKKEVTRNAILMSLSRMQRNSSTDMAKKEEFKIQSLTVHSNLTTLTFHKTEEVMKLLIPAMTQWRTEQNYLVVNQGTTEVTIIVDAEFAQKICSIKNLQPKSGGKQVSAIGIRFDQQYANVPGFLYFLVQFLAFQNINIVEVSSTLTELTFYLAQKDIRLAFDTLEKLFEPS